MARRSCACAFAMGLAAVSPLAAQTRTDLTGKPVATITEPFSAVASLRDLGGGRVLVTDPVERHLVLVDFGTGSVRVLGRNGEGPGEYRFAGAVAAAPGGESWLYDPPIGRLTLVTPDGRLTRSIQAPANIMGFRGSDRAGNLYFEGNEYDPATGGFSRMVPVMRHAPGTGKTAAVARVSTGGRVVIERPSGPASVTRRSSPYPHVDTWVPMPDGRIAIARADTFRVDFVSPDGHVTRGPLVAHRPEPVTARDRKAFRDARSGARVSANRGGGGGGPSMPAFTWEDRDFPVHHPPFSHDAVLAAPEGTVWIGASVGAGRAGHYFIVDGTGRVTGSVIVRPNSRVVGFGTGVVYIARTDPADDLVYLEKYAR